MFIRSLIRKCFVKDDDKAVVKDEVVVLAEEEEEEENARVVEILEKEPLIDKSKAILSSFLEKLNQRTPVGMEPTTANLVARGTNLAAVLSALHNSNEQLVPIARMEEIGFSRSCGATADSFISSIPILRDFVFAVDLSFGGKAIESVITYSLTASLRNKDEKNAAMKTIVRSKAALIPAIVVGELLDP